MATYRSKFAPLHKLRVAHRDAQQARLAQALRAQDQLEMQGRAIEAEIEAARQSQRQALEAEPNVTVLLETERYELVLKAQAAAVARQLEVVAAEVAQRRADLAAAQQEVRVIEKLDDRRRAAYEQQAERREQRRMDEVATNQYLRQQAP